MTKQAGMLSASIIIPKFNESSNMVNLLKSIYENYHSMDLKQLEVIVVDENFPDLTTDLSGGLSIANGAIVRSNPVKVVTAQGMEGLSSVIYDGLLSASGDIVVVMNADFSHAPELVLEMIYHMTHNKELDLVIASRYAEGRRIKGWNIKTRLVNIVTTKIARHTLGTKEIKDPLSGFFAIRRTAIRDIKFESIEYNTILLEILVKADLGTVIEIPYNFRDSREDNSKLGFKSIINYLKIFWKFYSYKQGQQSRDAAAIQEEKEGDALRGFMKKAGKFYLVGAIGLLVNYGSSFLIGKLLLDLYYMHATAVGIGLSILSNFLLNKLWTFNDKDFNIQKVARQAFWFVLSCMIGIALQISLVYYFIEIMHFEYIFSLGLAILLASSANFLAAKKLAFRENLMV